MFAGLWAQEVLEGGLGRIECHWPQLAQFLQENYCEIGV
jgi:hypothetical protein